MQQGWIKLHRQLKEKGYYQNSQYVHLWVHLLLSANHKEHEFMWNNNIILIKEGQLITGRKQLCQETGIPESTIERILNMLENEHQIEQQKTTKYRLITILNWNQFQTRTSEWTANGQQADTYKNDNNENKLNTPINKENTGELKETPCDSDGVPIIPKAKKETKPKDNFAMSVVHLWVESVQRETGIAETDIPISGLYFAILACLKRDKLDREEFRSLFKYFFKSMKKEEMKLSFHLCLSDSFVKQFKVSQRKKVSTFAELSGEISLN